ncbi:hypothetical protein DSECCO2_510960 [anaerobic digester metagenome]
MGDGIMRKWMLLFILCVCVLGCENKGTTYKETTNENIANDEINRKEAIDKEGFFEDSAGYKFDKYIVSDHFELYYNSKNELNKFYATNSIKILEEEYNRILEFLSVDSTNMPIVKINMYDEYECLRQSIISEAFFDPDDMDINFAGVMLSKDTFYYTLKHESGKSVDLETVLVHEFVHTVAMALTNGKMQIDWLWEGTARYLTEDTDYSKVYYKELIEKGIPDRYLLKRNVKYRYNYGYSMVEFIVETYGREKLVDLLMDYGDIEEVLNITESEFKEGWKVFVEGKISSMQ